MAFDLAMETARRMLGYRAPRYRCVEAILAEVGVPESDAPAETAAWSPDDGKRFDASFGAPAWVEAASLWRDPLLARA